MVSRTRTAQRYQAMRAVQGAAAVRREPGRDAAWQPSQLQARQHSSISMRHESLLDGKQGSSWCHQVWKEGDE